MALNSSKIPKESYNYIISLLLMALLTVKKLKERVSTVTPVQGGVCAALSNGQHAFKPEAFSHLTGMQVNQTEPADKNFLIRLSFNINANCGFCDKTTTRS